MGDRPRWLDEVRKPPKAVPAGSTRPAPSLLDDRHQPITTADQWRARRAELERRWLDFLGEIAPHRDAPPPVVLEEDRTEGVVRRLVRYESEPGLPVEAYLLRPEQDLTGKPRPGVVVLHSTVDYTIRQPAGLEGPPEKWIGLHLARRGYVTVCPRCFLWQHGARGKLGSAVDWLRKRHPRVTGMAKMLHDARRALDLLATTPGVDPARLGAVGHSLGAKEVLYLAAFDPRVKAAVSSEGGIGLTYSNWDAPWYLGDAIKRPGFPLDHGQVLALAAPRGFLLMGGDSADGDRSWPYVEAALPVWSLLGAPDAIGLFNHRQGHAYPPESVERTDGWLDWLLT